MATRSTSSVLFTLLVGTALGVMIAPASGRETRRRLMEKGTGAKDTLHYLLMEAGDLVDQLRSMIGHLGPDHGPNGNGSRSYADRERPQERGASGRS